MLPSTTPTTIDAIRLLSAVADIFSGRRIGFGLHAAHVAARFTAYRGRDAQTIAAAFYAAALHHIGAVRVVVPRDASARDAEIARWDDPAVGAQIVGAMGIFPPATADAVRWHRESFDGTGFPDRLRWSGIPETAMTVNVARAFVEALEEQAQSGGSAADAVFTLVEASGTIFTLTTMRDFRDFLAATAETFDASYEPEWTLPAADPLTLVTVICSHIDARQHRTQGRGDRLARIVRSLAMQLGDGSIDPDRAAFVSRLTALARTGSEGSTDDAFTLSRLGLESRAARAQTAAQILAAAPSFERFAPIVAATEEWYDGTGLPDRRAGNAIDPTARLLAVAFAAEAVVASDARERIAGAAGKRLDPTIVSAYLSAEVKR